MAIPKGMFDKLVERKATTHRTLGSLSGGLQRGQLAVVAGMHPPTVSTAPTIANSSKSKLLISLEKDN